MESGFDDKVKVNGGRRNGSMMRSKWIERGSEERLTRRNLESQQTQAPGRLLVVDGFGVRLRTGEGQEVGTGTR